MNCPHCGRASESSDKFCAFCGQPLAPARKFCTQCGAELRTEVRFCPQCGNPTESPSPSAAKPAPTATQAPPVAAPAPRPVPATPIKVPPLNKIKEMFDQGAKEQARDLLAEFVKSKPKDAAAWTTLGEFYRKLDQDALAEQAYQTALKLDGKQTQAYIGLGILARRAADYNKALDYYIAALKVDPRSGQAWSSAAVVAIKLGQDTQAVEFAEKGWELDRSDPALAANLAVAYHYAGRIKDRDRMYKQAQRMKYDSLDNIDKIFRGEISLRA
jgi:Flp pilus assembly protein TadD